jgi:hypothetical protein
MPFLSTAELATLVAKIPNGGDVWASIILEEQIDEESFNLMLASDLKALGIVAGPRAKIANAITQFHIKVWTFLKTSLADAAGACDLFLAGWNAFLSDPAIGSQGEMKFIKILNVIPLQPPESVRERFASRSCMLSDPNIRLLWHGTASVLCVNATCGHPQCSLCGIQANGFDPAQARANSGSFKVHGHSTYFADTPVVCHCYNGQNETVIGKGLRMVILSAVALGKSLKITDWFDKMEGNLGPKKRPDPSEVFRSLFGRDPAPDEYQAWENPDPFQPMLVQDIPFPKRPGPLFDSITEDLRGISDYEYRKKLQISEYPHYLITDPSLALPLFALLYSYPPHYQEEMPKLIQGREPAQSTLCPFHCMKHLGEGHSCDALSPSHNLLLFNGANLCSEGKKK